MTRWFAVWAVILVGIAIFGHTSGNTWLTMFPIVLPIIYADQYIGLHCPEEE